MDTNEPSAAWGRNQKAVKRKDGRVERGARDERQKPMTARSLPLVKPDMQISRIRLSQDVLARRIHR